MAPDEFLDVHMAPARCVLSRPRPFSTVEIVRAPEHHGSKDIRWPVVKETAIDIDTGPDRDHSGAQHSVLDDNLVSDVAEQRTPLTRTNGVPRPIEMYRATKFGINYLIHNIVVTHRRSPQQSH